MTRHVCHGGPLAGATFDLIKEDKAVIRSGDGRPGQYRRTGRHDSAGRVIWKHEPTPEEKAKKTQPLASHV